jgi:hypothetical protein
VTEVLGRKSLKVAGNAAVILYEKSLRPVNALFLEVVILVVVNELVAFIALYGITPREILTL